MKTNHVESTRKTEAHERPAYLPYLTAEHFCKAKYSHKDMRCYTARLLDIFLDERKPYVAAYREFRLKTMDVLYEHFKDDHASTGADRAKVFNAVAQSLDYKQINMVSYVEWWALELFQDKIKLNTPNLLTWLPALLDHYEKQVKLYGFTPDESLRMVRAAQTNWSTLQNIGNRLHNISCSLQTTNEDIAIELEHMALTLWGK